MKSFEHALLRSENSEQVLAAVVEFESSLARPAYRVLSIASDIMKPILREIVGTLKYDSAKIGLDEKMHARTIGIVFFSVTFVFVVIVFVLKITGVVIDVQALNLLSIILAMGIAASGGFLGGEINSKGALRIPIAKGNEVKFSATGAIALLIVSLVLFRLLLLW